MARDRLKENAGFGDLVGQSPQMQRLYRMIARVAAGKHPILLLGERGSGKSAVAHAIHSLGPFPERPFVVVDCAAAGASLADSEFFGVGASKLKDGSQAGPAGTLFLREAWAMPPVVQARLVRALQERDIRAMDGGKTFAAEARIIAASSRDLELAVQQATFRRDLYFRLNVVSLQLPALRERKEDIVALAEHLLAKTHSLKGTPYSLSPEAAKALISHHWPGNVAELRDCLECAKAACPGPVLTVQDLPLKTQPRGSASESDGGPAEGSRILPLAEVEKQTILRALERLNGDKVMTARLLGIGKTTLYRKLKEYGIGEPWISRPAPNR
ncbi:MAG TPA: sigma-54 dependent transcriptional regulator [Candidatus Angelobacter sp.]